MTATFELETLTTQPCRECAGRHVVRAQVVVDEEHPAPALVGFFGACPETGARAWFVVQAPERSAPIRLVRLGPIDDDTWDPDREIGFESTPPAHWRVAAPGGPPSGTKNGGFRAPARTPDLLRWAWGCPFSS